MRRILIKSAIALTCLIVALIAWVAGARSLSLFLDRFHTVQIDSQPIAQLGIEDANRGMLRINDLPMSNAMPNYSPYPMEMKVDSARQFVVQSGGHAIVLGRVDDSSDKGHGMVIRPEPGDKARFRVERGLLSWPTPLAINFISGHSPSWKRHLITGWSGKSRMGAGSRWSGATSNIFTNSGRAVYDRPDRPG